MREGERLLGVYYIILLYYSSKYDIFVLYLLLNIPEIFRVENNVAKVEDWMKSNNRFKYW